MAARRYLPLLHAPRPVVRGDCEDGERPCPHAGCRYHLGLHITRTSVWVRREGRRPRALPLVRRQGLVTYVIAWPPELVQWAADSATNGRDTCALDVADRGPNTLEAVAEALGLTRERVRQIEQGALAKLRLAVERAREDG